MRVQGSGRLPPLPSEVQANTSSPAVPAAPRILTVALPSQPRPSGPAQLSSAVFCHGAVVRSE